MGDIKMAIKAMNDDSERWSDVSGDLKKAGSDAAGLDIGYWAFPTQTDIDLQGLYQQLQDKITNLLNGGSTETKEIADELIHVRNVLQGSDEGARDSLDGLWDW